MENITLDFILSFFNSWHQTLLIRSDPYSIKADYAELIKALHEKKLLSGILINFNNPSVKEKEECRKHGIDTSNVFFIDGVAVHADHLPDDPNIFFLFNAKDLDGIEVGLKNAFSKKKEIEMVVIDLLDVLLYYNSIRKINEMIGFLKNEAREKKFKVLIFMNKENEILLNNVRDNFDKEIEV